MAETRKTRPVSWLKATLNEFEKFPEGARTVCLTALTMAAEGGKADIAKPMHGLRRFRDCAAFQRRCLPRRLRGPARGGNLGRACVPEEIDQGGQDAPTRV